MITLAIFLIEVFLYNFIKPDLPKIPGDIRLDKIGLRIYIPFVSTIALTFLASIVFSSFFK